MDVVCKAGIHIYAIHPWALQRPCKGSVMVTDGWSYLGEQVLTDAVCLLLSETVNDGTLRVQCEITQHRFNIDLQRSSQSTGGM